MADDTVGGNGTPEDLRQRLLIRQQALVLHAVATFLDAETLRPAAIALVEDLHHRFDCERVVLALGDAADVRIEAVSQQSRVDRRASETRLIEQALVEAIRHERAIRFDAAEVEDDLPAHRALHANRTNLRLLSIPLFRDREAVGALLLERRSETGWADRTPALLQTLADVLTPLIVLRRASERPLVHRLAHRARAILNRSPFGARTRHVVAASILVLAPAIGAIVPVDHVIVAEAVVTPIERRHVTAPFTGYVAGVVVSTGDAVEAGQVLLRLDRRELVLQRNQWQADLDSASAELRLAMATHDRAAMAVLRARRGRAAAEVERIESLLTRAEIRAPVDGLVVSGTLDELSGRPVERGETLMEMASADGYEVELLVDETDTPYVKPGDGGHLSLTARPGERHAFTLRSVHPIAVAAAGQTRFRIEAALDSAPERLLPGQTGVGRVIGGEASLLWVLTHRFRDWSRQRLWEWFG